MRNSRRLLLIGAVILVPIAIGSTRLVRETDFTRNFRQDSPLIQGYQFDETKFSGAGVWDIFLAVPKRLDKKFLGEVIDFERHLLQTVPQLTKAISLADILDAGCGGLVQLDLGAKIAIRSGISLMRE